MTKICKVVRQGDTACISQFYEFPCKQLKILSFSDDIDARGYLSLKFMHGTIHNGEGLCSTKSQTFISIELTAGIWPGDDVESDMFQPR